VRMVVAALEDCTSHGDVVVAPDRGCGSALIAAERTGRSLVAIEADPIACDRAIWRWEQVTGLRSHKAEGHNRPGGGPPYSQHHSAFFNTSRPEPAPQEVPMTTPRYRTRTRPTGCATSSESRDEGPSTRKPPKETSPSPAGKRAAGARSGIQEGAKGRLLRRLLSPSDSAPVQKREQGKPQRPSPRIARPHDSSR
jgi:hypothetical protein